MAAPAFAGWHCCVRVRNGTHDGVMPAPLRGLSSLPDRRKERAVGARGRNAACDAREPRWRLRLQCAPAPPRGSARPAGSPPAPDTALLANCGVHGDPGGVPAASCTYGVSLFPLPDVTDRTLTQ